MKNVYYYNSGEVIPTCLHHDSLTLAFLEYRMHRHIDTLCRGGTIPEDDVRLQADLGPFPSPVFGVIYLASGRILELHILDVPRVIDATMKKFCFASPEQIVSATCSTKQ